MKSLVSKIDAVLKEIEVWVDDITFENHELLILLDSNKTIDLDLIVEATNLISPVVDANFNEKDAYVLNIASKEKGGN